MAQTFPFGPPPFDADSASLLSRPRYGTPGVGEAAFQEYMVRQRRTAWWARKQFGIEGGRGGPHSSYREHIDGPVWCFTRFGRTVTQLPFGRLFYVGGEHEDWYDPDFCIYNDVVIEDANGGIEIVGYQKNLFPPTDFHTATLVGTDLWLIGSLGYQDLRREGETQVMQLDTENHRMRPVATTGDNPGWISGHLATIDRQAREILISGGKIWMTIEDEPKLSTNIDTFVLSLDSLVWRRLDRS